MKKVFCDKHLDREAVATFKIREFPVGFRSLLLIPGYEIGVTFIDLCEECAELVRPLTPGEK